MGKEESGGGTGLVRVLIDRVRRGIGQDADIFVEEGGGALKAAWVKLEGGCPGTIN